MNTCRLLTSTSIALFALCTTSTAFAQTEGDAEAESSQGFDMIVVTAQRREEDLQSAAVAISALSGSELASEGVTTADQLSRLFPALDVAPAAGGKSLFYLRGVGNFASNSLSSSAVAVTYNDVYISRSQGAAGIFYDLARVEVLKGPQGTLYGVNATGGAINVIPAQARLGETSGFVNAEYGNYDAVRLEGALNLPLGDQAAIRAAALYVKHDGYMSDGLSDQNDLSARLSFNAEPSDILSIALVLDYYAGRGQGGGSTLVSNVGGAFTIDDRVGLTDPRAQAIYNSTYIFIGGSTLVGLPRGVASVNADNWGLTGTINWETALGNLTVIGAHRENSADSNFIQPGFLIHEDARNQQDSLEVRLTSDDTSVLSYIVGAYLFDDSGQIPSYQTNAQFNGSFQSYEYGTENYSGFGRLNFHVSPDVTLSIGGRYTREESTFAGTTDSYNRLCFANTPPVGGPPFGSCPGALGLPFGGLTPPTVIGGGTTGPVAFFPTATQVQTLSSVTNDSGDAWEKFTWRAAADWQITPDNLVFASYETGFKSGGFFFSNDTNTFEPETIQAWTLGSNNTFIDGHLRLNLEAFYWRYKNQQISHLGQDSTGTIIFPTENVGRATFKGFEIDSQVLLTDTTRLGANFQYLDANYGSFVYNVPISLPPQTGCATTPLAAIGRIQVDCSGFRPPNAPKWVIRLEGDQTIPLGDAGDLVIDASASYRSETLTGLEFLPVELQEGYWLVDAGITFTDSDDRFSIGAFIRNAFNETVFTNTFPPPLTAGLFAAALRPPRTFGVRAGINF